MEIRDDAGVSAARILVRQVGGAAGIPRETVESVAIIASELTTNQLRYAGGGRLAARAIERDGVRGMELEADDEGPGILDPTRAFAGEAPRSGSLGIGLAGVRRLSNELDVDTRRGEGTRILARVFAGPFRRRPSVAIFGVGLPSEPASGDAARFWRLEDALVVMLCDGLGHGKIAREASDRALAIAGQHPDESPTEILTSCMGALRGTRGAVIALGRLEERRQALHAASVGNIQMGLRGPGGVVRIPGSPGYIGSAQGRPVRPIDLPSARGSTWVLATDGVHDALGVLAEARALPPWALAQRILEQGRKAHDDALVVVVQ